MSWAFPFEILALGDAIPLYLAWTNRLWIHFFFSHTEFSIFLESLEYYLKEGFSKCLACPISLLKSIILNFSIAKKIHFLSLIIPLVCLNSSFPSNRAGDVSSDEERPLKIRKKTAIWAWSWRNSLEKNLRTGRALPMATEREGQRRSGV